MGKTTIYLNKEAEEIHKLAKEYAGDNLSAVIVQGLKLYVEKMECQSKGMEDVVIFDGKYFELGDIYQGKNLKFIGRLISQGSTDYGHGDEHLHSFKLYLTRKGKFLMYGIGFNKNECAEVHFHKIFNTFSEVMGAGYPASMLDEARRSMPDVACEELDI